MNTPQNMMGGSSNNMMDSLKSNMMTMLMINNMNGGRSQQGNGNGGGDMFSMIYVFVATSVVDFVFKNAPTVVNFVMKKYTDKWDNIKKDLSNTTKDITDNKVKKKTASITVTINVNNPDNILGQALLDFITNNKNTTHVSYVRESFILNQKDVINIDDEIFARMTQSSSADELGNQGSTSTNMHSGSGSNGVHSAIVQIIEVYSFTKTTDQLRNFLDNIKQKYAINVKNKLGNKRYYFNMHPLIVPMDIDKRKDLSRLPPNFAFVMKHFQTNRKFSNLFGKDIETIRNRVNFFCKNRKWYDEKGIPYTLGLLLSGAPGTGKTSTIKCLANETNRHICNVNLNNDMSKTQLENLFFNENLNVMNPMTGQAETYCIPLDQRIYVLEDVDCQSDIVMERALKNNKNENKNNDNEDRDTDKAVLEHYEDKHKVDLSFLLNLLDGVLENPGRIVIMTSNFPDMLDSALIRPGRIDVIAKFRNCSNATILQMLEFFYDTQLSEEDAERIQNLKEEIITPAEMSKVMFENFSDIQASIIHMENLSNTGNLGSLVRPLLPGEQLEITGSEEVEEDDNQTLPVAIPEYDTSKKKDELQTSPDQSSIEEKGEIFTPSSYVKTNEQIIERIHRDTTYVFMKYKLAYFSSANNQIKLTKNDCHKLLVKYIFCNYDYKNLIHKLKTKFYNIVISPIELENMNDIKTNYTAVREKNSYSRELGDFFDSSMMIKSGLRLALVEKKIIDNEYGTITGDFTSAPSVLNSSSYSAF
jgi:DNA polymerase III delta prime subunit